MKSSKHLTLYLFLFITFLGIFVRFWNYPSLVNFSLDPPVYLMEAKQMLDSRQLRLVGPMLTSKMVDGRGFFLGPFYDYALAVLGWLTNWNVYVITAFFTLLWIAAFIGIFFWLKGKFGVFIALLTYLLISLLPVYLPMSRTIWNPHFLPLFGFLLIYFLDKKPRTILNYFIAGIFFGLGLNVHYSAILWVLIVIYFVIFEIRRKDFNVTRWLCVFLGILAAEAPLILFEFRHDFYNLRTILFQLRYAKLSGGYTFALGYYYIYSTVGVVAYLLAASLEHIRHTKAFKNAVIAVLILGIVFLYIDLGKYGQAPAHPEGWDIATQQRAVEMIINDDVKQIEVAETISSDTQAKELRWWLEREGKNVMGYADYPEANVLYLIADGSRDPNNENVWEVSSMKPFRVEFKQYLNDDVILYKLVRE